MLGISGTRWLLAVVALFAAAPTFGRTLVVAKSGDDHNAGTPDAPLLTISKAADVARPGDTVLVREGVYRERVAPARSGEPGKPIIYRAASGERVVVKGSEVWEPNWRDEGDGVFSAVPDESLFDDRSDEYVDGHNPFEVELSSTPYGREGRREHERLLAGERRIRSADERIVYTCGQVFVAGRPLREVPLREEIEAGTWFYEPGSKRIYVHLAGSAPGEQQIEISTRRRIFAPKKRGLGHITVEGFVFEHCGNQYPTNFWKNDAYAQKGAVGVEAGHHWIIRRNVVRYAKAFAIDVGRVDRHNRPEESHDNLVEQNYLLDNGSAGVLSNGSLNLVIRGNVILRNNRLRFSGIKRWEHAGIKCHHFRSGLIEGNYVADNVETYGVWLDNQFPDSRVSRNVIAGNGAAGVFLEMSDYGYDRLLIDNNVVVDNAESAVYIHDASGATFVHNLLADSRPAGPHGNRDRQGQAVYIRQVDARTKTYHHSFYGNILADNRQNIDVNYPSARSGPQRFNHNVYDVEPGSRAFRINRYSDKPSPWSESAFQDLIIGELRNAGHADAPPFDNAKALLTAGDWRRFWRGHNVENDTHSLVQAQTDVQYDAESHMLMLSIDFDPSTVGYESREQIEHDFFGEQHVEGDRPPGPFRKLERGDNEFLLWSGLPVLPPHELPPLDWN